MHIVKVGGWHFEIKQIRAIKTPEFYMPYKATALITIVNGEPAIENLLSIDGFTRRDFKDIECFLQGIGFEKVSWRRFDKEGQHKEALK